MSVWQLHAQPMPRTYQLALQVYKRLECCGRSGALHLFVFLGDRARRNPPRVRGKHGVAFSEGPRTRQGEAITGVRMWDIGPL